MNVPNQGSPLSRLVFERFASTIHCCRSVGPLVWCCPKKRGPDVRPTAYSEIVIDFLKIDILGKRGISEMKYVTWLMVVFASIEALNAQPGGRPSVVLGTPNLTNGIPGKGDLTI